MSVRRFVSVAVTALAFVVARPALAQSDQAEALFQEGVRLFETGAVHDACQRFGDSYALEPKNGTLQNLALCHEREGKTATAFGEWASLIARALSAGQADRERTAREHCARLEPQIGYATVRMPSGTKPTQIRVDGKVIEPSLHGAPVALDPGAHVFEVMADGKAHTVRIEMPAGHASITVDGAPPPSPAPVPPPPADDPDPGHGRRIGGTLSLAGGLATIGVGAVFGIVALSKRSDADASCGARAGIPENTCLPSGVELDKQAAGWATASTIAFGVGILTSGVGAYFLLTAPSRTSATRVGFAPGLVTLSGALPF